MFEINCEIKPKVNKQTGQDIRLAPTKQCAEE